MSRLSMPLVQDALTQIDVNESGARYRAGRPYFRGLPS